MLTLEFDVVHGVDAAVAGEGVAQLIVLPRHRGGLAEGQGVVPVRLRGICVWSDLQNARAKHDFGRGEDEGRKATKTKIQTETCKKAAA